MSDDNHQIRRHLSIRRTAYFRRRGVIPPSPTTTITRRRSPPHLPGHMRFLPGHMRFTISLPPLPPDFIRTGHEETAMISPPSSAARVFAVREFPERIGGFLEGGEQERIRNLFEPRFSEDEIARAITVLLPSRHDNIAAEDEIERAITVLLPSRHDNIADGVCVVCQDNLAGEDDRTVGMLNCRHQFHVGCIREWLLRKNQCPLCKAPASKERSDDDGDGEDVAAVRRSSGAPHPNP